MLEAKYGLKDRYCENDDCDLCSDDLNATEKK